MELTKTQQLKLHAVVFFLMICLGAILYHTQSRIFPATAIFAVLGASTLFLSTVLLPPRSRRHWLTILSASILLALFVRGYIFLKPATLIGFDPNTFAGTSSAIAATGHTHALTVDFYNIASNFFIYPAMLEQVVDVKQRMVYGVFSLISALLSPLLPSLLAYRFAPSDRYMSASIVAVLGALAPMSIYGSTRPIPQYMAVLLFLCALLCLHLFRERGDTRIRELIVVFAIAMLFTHKLPLLMFFVVVSTVYLFDQFWSRYPRWSMSWRPARISGIYMILIGVLVAIQFLILTSFVIRLANFGAAFSILASGSSVVEGVTPSAATAPPQTLPIFQSHSHMFLSLLLSGVAWLTMLSWYRKDSERTTFLVVIAALVAVVGIFMIGFFSPSLPQPTRFYLFAELPLIALIGLGATAIAGRVTTRKTIVGVLMVLLIFQGFSGTVAPDFPSQARYYLTNEEVEGKQFGHEYSTSDVHTDTYYVDTFVQPGSITNPNSAKLNYGGTRPDLHFTRYDAALFNSELTPNQHPVIAYRTNVRVYRTSPVDFSRSTYVLTYDPEAWLETTYNRAYSNGGVTYYIKTR